MGFPVGPFTFTAAAGTALTAYNAGWTNQRGADILEISSGGNSAWLKAGGSEGSAKWDGDTFTADQYAQCKLTNAANYAGPTARMTGTSVATQCGYVFFGVGGGGLLQRYDNGTRAGLQGGMGSPAAGDTAKIEIIGTSIKCYINGVQVGTTVVDATYATGQPGLSVINAQTAELDDWTADTIPTGGGGGRGLFRTPSQSGIGVGGSFFRDPLQAREQMVKRDHIYVPERYAA